MEVSSDSDSMEGKILFKLKKKKMYIGKFRGIKTRCISILLTIST